MELQNPLNKPNRFAHGRNVTVINDNPPEDQSFGIHKSTGQSGITVTLEENHFMIWKLENDVYSEFGEVNDKPAIVLGWNDDIEGYYFQTLAPTPKLEIRVIGVAGNLVIDSDPSDGIGEGESDLRSFDGQTNQGSIKSIGSGQKGEQGEQGPMGIPGLQGQAGLDGVGLNGAKGEPGQKGEPGSGEGESETLSDYSSENQSTFLGTSAGENQQTPAVNPVTQAAIESENVGIGYQALQDTTTGTNNVAIGSNSLSENTTGFNNVAISKGALGDYLLNNTTIGIGFDAGAPYETSGAIDGHIGNTMMGHQAMNDFNIKDTAAISNNTAIGLRALRGIGGTEENPKLNNVKNNTAIGRQAGLGIAYTAGGALNHNTFLGNSAGMNAVPQQGNMMSNLLLGARAGMGGYIGDNNIVMQNATADTPLGNANWGVSGNISIGGNSALYSDNNVLIGNGADSAPNTIGASDIDDETKGVNQSGNMILAGSGNTISNTGGKKVQTNSILSGTSITIGGTAESKDNFVANSKGITLNGTRNVIIASELDSEDSTQSIYGSKNTVLNSQSFSISSNSVLNTIINSSDVVVSESQGRMGSYNSQQINFAGGQEHVAIRSFSTSFLGGQKTVAIRDQNSGVSGTNMVLINTSNISCNGRDVTFIGGSNHQNLNGGEGNVYIGGNGATGSTTSDDNIFLGAISASVSGANNIVAGSTHSVNATVKHSFIHGAQHNLEPAANAQRNIIVGYQNTVTSGNNSFIGGTKSDINQSNSFGFGKGVQLEHGNMAGFGKFNDGAANDGASALFTVGCGANDNIRRNAMNVVLSTVGGANNKAVVYLDQVVNYNYENDSAASDAGIGVGGLYHTEGTLKIRIA